ncbi:ABC transporter permease subunit [Thaumasiovibrio subtropicus]|uniref:ABC transporter permease subunit n=1 Tax=Thaumasiovibrio subtropicus TaxID=1891207 RepID=UPI000B354A54|nr:ABC transporter permease subunit [Thaumasiovibrio subtropicus]
MATAPNFEMTAGTARRFWDRVARIFVTAGGVSALLMLVLIFFYLLMVIFPTVKQASVSISYQNQTPTWQGESLHVGTLADNKHLYRVAESGIVSFYSLGDRIEKQHDIQFPDVSAYAGPVAGGRVMAFGHSTGEITVFEPVEKESRFEGNSVPLTGIEYPFGGRQLQLDPQGQPIVSLKTSMSNEFFTAVGQTLDGRWLGIRLEGDVNPITYKTEWHETRFTLPIPNDYDAIALAPTGQFIYVLARNRVYVYTATDDGYFLRETVRVGSEADPATELAVLPGASSVLIGSASKVRQWFDVRDDEGRRSLTPIRTYTLRGEGIPKIVVEQYRKSFMTVQPDGEVGLFYTTSRRPLLQTQLALPHQMPNAISFSSYGDGVTLSYMEGVYQLSVRNPHPEVTFSSLFEKVWYEGYPEPDFVWQSTSGSEQFEPKMSLVPLVFGTLKAAAVAMLFSVPLAVSGAVYTAYFMSSRMRAVVKPTIELMEALPTVILGFLAGLWLAPLVENNLSALFLLVFAVPLMTLVMGLFWYWGPQRLGWQIPNGLHVVLLLPLLVLVVWGCFAANEWAELTLFDGDARLYLSRELGLGFDQRNAIVVGIAMGFAVIPTIFTIAEDAIYSVPQHLTSGSLALGATHWQTLSRVILITASPGIFSAIMMGVARAIGETMIVLMATGNTPIMEMNLLQGMRTLAANIAIEMPESEVGSSHYRVLFLSALVLFIFTFIFNTLAEVVRQRLREQYSNL